MEVEDVDEKLAMNDVVEMGRGNGGRNRIWPPPQAKTGVLTQELDLIELAYENGDAFKAFLTSPLGSLDAGSDAHFVDVREVPAIVPGRGSRGVLRVAVGCLVDFEVVIVSGSGKATDGEFVVGRLIEAGEGHPNVALTPLGPFCEERSQTMNTMSSFPWTVDVGDEIRVTGVITGPGSVGVLTAVQLIGARVPVPVSTGSRLSFHAYDAGKLSGLPWILGVALRGIAGIALGGVKSGRGYTVVIEDGGDPAVARGVIGGLQWAVPGGMAVDVVCSGNLNKTRVIGLGRRSVVVMTDVREGPRSPASLGSLLAGRRASGALPLVILGGSPGPKSRDKGGKRWWHVYRPDLVLGPWLQWWSEEGLEEASHRRGEVGGEGSGGGGTGVWAHRQGSGTGPMFSVDAYEIMHGWVIGAGRMGSLIPSGEHMRGVLELCAGFGRVGGSPGTSAGLGDALAAIAVLEHDKREGANGGPLKLRARDDGEPDWSSWEEFQDHVERFVRMSGGGLASSSLLVEEP